MFCDNHAIFRYPVLCSTTGPGVLWGTREAHMGECAIVPICQVALPEGCGGTDRRARAGMGSTAGAENGASPVAGVFRDAVPLMHGFWMPADETLSPVPGLAHLLPPVAQQPLLISRDPEECGAPVGFMDGASGPEDGMEHDVHHCRRRAPGVVVADSCGVLSDGSCPGEARSVSCEASATAGIASRQLAASPNKMADDMDDVTSFLVLA